MNPSDYRTWTSFADHPAFSDRDSVADWSSDPDIYGFSPRFPVAFDPEWYVHVDPKLPTEVQASHAARDIRNLAEFCGALELEFTSFEHELFIMDDFTVFVQIKHPRFALDMYPHHYGDESGILSLHVEEPFDDDLVVDSVSEGVSLLRTRLGDS